MEKRIPLIAGLLFTALSLYAQTPDVIKRIRMPLWAELDAYPGLEEAQNTNTAQFDYPVNRIRTVAPFLINGMVYGWNFVYTPSDKLRNVAEHFEISEINQITESDTPINYSDPWIENNRLNCWVEYTRSPQMIWNYNLWSSINQQKIQGRGSGRIKDGFDGIKNAAEDALKNALRSYFRAIIKNKPKEIRGRVLIRSLPKTGIDAGRYIVDLDFFLETDRILMYTQY